MLSQRQPVPDPDALRPGALDWADACNQLRRQQAIVGSLGGQLTNR